ADVEGRSEAALYAALPAVETGSSSCRAAWSWRHGLINRGNQCVINNGITPSILDIADTANHGICTQTRTPVVDSEDELLTDLGCADLKEMHSAGRQAQSPHVRTCPRISGRWESRSECLAQRECPDVGSIVLPVAATYDGACAGLLTA